MDCLINTKVLSFIADCFFDRFKYEISNQDNRIINDEGIETFVFKRITSCKYRRSSLPNNTKEDLKSKIRMSVESGSPLQFTFPFGAYKSWNLGIKLEPCWAEVFNINFMCDILLPISLVYEPGISLRYSSCGEAMEMINNFPQGLSEIYHDVFKELIQLKNKYLPDNFKIEIIKIKDLYSDSEFYEQIYINYKNNYEKWESNYSSYERERVVESAKRNIMLKGKNDYTSLSTDEWNKICVDSAKLQDAYLSLSKRREFNKGGRSIQIVNIKGPHLSLHLGSSSASSVQFWMGQGVLEVRGERIIPHILSPVQLDSFNDVKEKTSIKSCSKLSRLSDNFSEIIVFQ
jgi:hypothetical protein